MTLERARSPFVWARRVLLTLALASVAGVGLLLAAAWFGKAGEQAPPAPAVAADSDIRERGTDFTFTQFGPDGQPLFRIRADKSRQDRSDNVFLDGVALEVFREGGESISIVGRSAIFHREAGGEAELEGEVVLRGWENLELQARALRLHADGQLLTSEGAVELRYPPDLVGRASSFTVDRRSDSITLAGGVHVRTVPGAAMPLRLDCDRLAYRQREGQVRAQGDVFLQRGDHQLQARAVTLFSEDGLHTIGALRARFDVVGNVARPAAEGSGMARIAYRGELLEVEPVAGSGPIPPEPEEGEDAEAVAAGEAATQTAPVEAPAEPEPAAEPGEATRRVVLQAAATDVTSVTITEPSGLERRLTGKRLIGRLDAGGRLVEIEAEGKPMELVERQLQPEPKVLRQASAGRGRAQFLPDGRVGGVVLKGDVQLADDQVQLAGGRDAALDMETGVLTVEGEAVELFDARGRVTAPRFRYHRDRGLIRAEGGVQAVLEEAVAGGFSGTPLGSGRGPVRVESREAVWTTEPPTFVFRDSARAWRGANLLLADQIRGDQRNDELAASGSVKTVWVPERPAAGGVQQAPIEVTATNLTYRERGRQLVYEGDVAVVQERRNLSCRQLTVELAEEGGRAERMLCRDKVRLVDAESRRQVLGDHAVYTLDRELVEVYGEKVRLFDAENNELVGKYLQYDIAAGTVQLRSQVPEAGSAGARPQ